MLFSKCGFSALENFSVLQCSLCCFYSSPWTSPPPLLRLSSANTVGCRSFITCRPPAVTTAGRTSALHHQRVEAQLTDQQKLMLTRSKVHTVRRCQIYLPASKTRRRQPAKWITDTPRTKVGKSLNGALNCHQWGCQPYLAAIKATQ